MNTTPMRLLPLVIVAQRLKQSYNRTMDMILTGQLAGERIQGRWYVTIESVEAIEQRDEAQTA
jgi:hypothetical protein